MMKSIILIVPLIFFIATCSYVETGQKVQKDIEKNRSYAIYDFVVEDIDGNNVKLEDFRGKVLLIVNVASKCEFTPQYQGLQKIYSKYKEQGFTVLGFPSNSFEQEPETNYEIKAFCESVYGVTFPMFSKISVKDEDKAPLYAFLTEKETNPKFSGEITWNFNKFLIDRNGKIIARFDSKDEPESPKIIAAIEKALK